MAENLSIKKSPVDCVQECPLCLHQLKLPQTLQQCLHSYCKSCLDKVPQKTQDGRQGWLCPMCEIFTNCDQIQQNGFIEELQKIHNEPENCDQVKCEQCLEDCGLATWKCAECKIGLCESGKAVHLKIPMLKGHKILPLVNDGVKLIDNIIFCNVHAGIPAQQNCRDCDQLICYTCNTTDHQGHIAETVEEALQRMLPETERSTRQVDENIGIIEAQIEGVKKEIEHTKESYASCRMQMDDHLEKVICQMRAMKSQMEEDVSEQESIALDILKQLKQQLENLLSQARIISNLTAVVINKTRHTSQLQQLQTELFVKVNAAGEVKNQRLSLNLPATNFVEGQSFKEEIENVFGKLCFDMKEQIIGILGESYTKPNQFLCSDFNELAETEYQKDRAIVVDVNWCNRLSYIDNQIWLPLHTRSKINNYDEAGELINVIDTGDKAITVVKPAYNGDIICAGLSGLFVTDKCFTRWTMLSEGEFSDVCVDQEKFIALQYDNPSVHTYSLQAVKNQKENSWHEGHSFKLNAHVKVDCNSCICIVGEQYILVSSTATNALYKFTHKGKYLESCEDFPSDPVICGTDKNCQVLVAGYEIGTMYLLEPLLEKLTERSVLLTDVHFPKTRSVVIDQNNELWVLAGDTGDGFKLIKFTSEQ